MSIERKIFIAAIVGLSFSTTSCKKYLDVNKNPNVTPTATVNVLLPTAETYIASVMGVDLEVNGSIWAQYWTQSPNASQYRNLEQYQPTSDTYEFPWVNMYAGGEDLNQLDKIAIATHNKQYQAIGLLLRAYMFQALTDGWGDIPFSQALKGQAADGGIISPKYDAQRIVYNGILGYIHQADTLLDPNDPVTPGGDDLIYGGNMAQWQKFANTLELRILLRLSEIDPGTAQAGIADLYTRNAAGFLGDGDDAQINFTNSSGNKNPLYTQAVEVGSTQNLVGSKTCIDSMNSNNDYRAYIFYEPTSSAGIIAGIQQGQFTQPATPSTYSIPSPYVAGDASNSASATAPVKLLTGYESFFLQAEAAARGWSGAGGDDILFKSGIRASLNSYSSALSNINILLADTPSTSVNGFPIQAPIYLTPDYAYYSYLHGDTLTGAPAAYWSKYPTTGTVQQKVRFIITQKWFAMCGNQGFEAWSEWRRTGYPDFFVISANSIIGNQFPKRFLYPNSEATRNSNFPGVQPVTSKVWWDIH